jgi:hypothetical protein
MGVDFDKQVEQAPAPAQGVSTLPPAPVRTEFVDISKDSTVEQLRANWEEAVKLASVSNMKIIEGIDSIDQLIQDMEDTKINAFECVRRIRTKVRELREYKGEARAYGANIAQAGVALMLAKEDKL